MAELLENLVVFVKMIFACLVQPNETFNPTYITLLDFIFNTRGYNNDFYNVRYIVLLSFGISLIGVSVGILKRFLWKN